MIATVTLNPAVDKTLNTSRVVMGQVNRMISAQNHAGGKGINVSKVLKQYDTESICLGFIGGYTGIMIRETVEGMGIKTSFTETAGLTRTSTNVISEDGYITEFLEPGPEISDKELKNFLLNYEKEIASCELVIISGSIPLGIKNNIYAELIKTANKMGKKVLLDSSGESLKNGMYARPFMMKPNVKELEGLAGKRLDGMQDIALAALDIVEWGVPNVMVSMGSRGILYAYDEDGEGKVLYMPAPKVKVVNTVGSGDSAVAAFALSYLKGLSKEETLRKCVSISAANTCSLENGIIPKEKALEFEKKLQILPIPEN